MFYICFLNNVKNEDDLIINNLCLLSKYPLFLNRVCCYAHRYNATSVLHNHKTLHLCPCVEAEHARCAQLSAASGPKPCTGCCDVGEVRCAWTRLDKPSLDWTHHLRQQRHSWRRQRVELAPRRRRGADAPIRPQQQHRLRWLCCDTAMDKRFLVVPF